MDESNPASFDYLIVGGGSAGCVLANRLSADGRYRVCLIEAGPVDNNPFIKIPFGLLFILRSKILNWLYTTTPQRHCGGRRMWWPRGRTLGGSSSINAMCYIRGNPEDYNAWAEQGNAGWSYADVLPYFKKLENFEPGANAFHGIGGPLNIASPRFINPLVNVFIEAGRTAGYKINPDFNGETQEGVGYFHLMQKNGERCSNARAYLRSTVKQNNVTIMTDAHVTKIRFEKKRAIGVSYYKNGVKKALFANKEIILCAGAIGSPQILLLSGVGAKTELEKHGIPIVQDLPGVGENLQDHIDASVCCIEKTRFAISLHPRAVFRVVRDLFNYLFFRRGEMTSNGAQACGFLKTDSTLTCPNLQWHFLPIMETHHATDLRAAMRYYGYTLKTCLLHPKSRGSIKLQNNNPLSAPLIDPNYFSVESDLEQLVTGVKKARELLAQPAFTPHFAEEFLPGAKVQTDEDIRAYIRSHCESIYHPIGTCKMGSDEMAVVDSTLKVRGLEGLRVIDASVIPTRITGNTNTVVTMIAEKGADLVIADRYPHPGGG